MREKHLISELQTVSRSLKTVVQKIVKLDTKTQKEMRKQAQPVYDAIKKSISKDIYNAYLSGVEK